MATRLAIASDPAVLCTAPTSLDLVLGPRKRSGPVGIPCIPGHGSHASAPAPSATVSLANRGGSALSENPVNGTPTSSVVLTQNGDKDGARESRASPPPTDRLRTRSHASACKITQALAGEDLLTHSPVAPIGTPTLLGSRRLVRLSYNDRHRCSPCTARRSWVALPLTHQ